MKHPEHKASKNQYSGRTNTKLGVSAKQELQDELKRFNERVKNLMK
jgi:hypothetical protein